MGTVTLEMGVRKFCVPEEKALNIQRIVEAYSPSGMGRVLIARHLLGFAYEDLAGFENWRRCGVVAPTDRFACMDDYENWHGKFKLIATEVMAENNLSGVVGCSC